MEKSDPHTSRNHNGRITMLIRVTPEELIGATESIIELETIARMAQEKASQLKNMPISPEEVHFIQINPPKTE